MQGKIIEINHFFYELIFNLGCDRQVVARFPRVPASVAKMFFFSLMKKKIFSTHT